MSRYILLFLFFCFSFSAQAQLSTPTPQPMLEMLVAVTDTSPSNLPREQRNAEILAEEQRANTKQGYISRAEPEGYKWGRLERDPKRFIIVKIPAADFNPEWLEPEYDVNKPIYKSLENENDTLVGYEVKTMRKYRLPLESVLSEQEITDLKAITYNSKEVLPEIKKTLTDTKKVIANDYFTNPEIEEIKLHGSSGTFTICTSGCDYTALQTAVSTEAADLTGTGPAIFEITEGFSDTTAVNVTGYTTTASDYVKIYTTVAARHDGKYDTSAYRLELASADPALSMGENYTVVDGVQVKNTITANFDSGIGAVTDISDTVISNSIVWMFSDGGDYYSVGISLSSAQTSGNPNVIYNTLVIANSNFNNDSHAAIASEFSHPSTIPFEINLYNMTTKGFGSAIDINDEHVTINATNCVFVGYVTSITGGIGTKTLDYCASDDGAGTNPQTLDSTSSYANEFVDYDNDDLHLVSGSVAENNGTNDPGSGLFSDDIDGDTRTGTWDIGADELTGASPTDTPTATPTNTPNPGHRLFYDHHWRSDMPIFYNTPTPRLVTIQ